jgi:Superinfection immunity protein
MKNRCLKVIAAAAMIGVCGSAHAGRAQMFDDITAAEYCDYIGTTSIWDVAYKKDKKHTLQKRIDSIESNDLEHQYPAGVESREIALVTEIFHTDGITGQAAFVKYKAQCEDENWYWTDIAQPAAEPPKPMIDTHAAGDAILYILGVLAFFGFAGLCGYIYFLPTFIARRRQKRNTGAIFALNFFLGWSLVGWVVALVWALAYDVTGVYAPRGEPS